MKKINKHIENNVNCNENILKKLIFSDELSFFEIILFIFLIIALIFGTNTPPDKKIDNASLNVSTQKYDTLVNNDTIIILKKINKN